ncbi:MAG: CDP-alcohol phosphatidyltransferase family protein [Candidatus Staskawiczbacteria bacterium]|nr:CDP-alcohol phosphatidyltransferase family protein [Candidatus Staskawiczbacteria bacterium]
MERINPNFITSLRVIFFAPIACLALMHGCLCTALIAMVLGEFTDFFDGFVARYKLPDGTNRVSDFGKIYDPMCDSIFHMVIWITLLSLGWISPYFVIIFFSRDAIVSNIRIFLIRRGIVLAARWSGKIKAGTQAVAQIAIVISHLSVAGGALENFQFSAVLVAVGVTLFSLCDYGWDAYRKFTKTE